MVIPMSFLSDKMKFADVVDDFLTFIKDKRFIIHNAEFDLISFK